MRTIWKMLGIGEDSTIEEIRAAYAKRTRECHPEENPEEFAQLQKAYKEALRYVKHKNRIQDFNHWGEITEPIEKKEEAKQKQETYLMDMLADYEERLHKESANSPAMQGFKAIFADDEKRQDRMEWRQFFLTETFLEEQYEEAFVRVMHEFLEQQKVVPFTGLPDGLVVELAIVYVLRPEEDDFLVAIEEYGSELYDWKNVSVFQEIVADIWNSQENCENNYRELQTRTSLLRRKSYDDYRIMRDVVLHNTWNYTAPVQRMEEYKFTLSMAHWRSVLDDDQINNRDIDFLRLMDDFTHVCEVELYDYLLRKYSFPIGACAYMYKEFKLENIEKTEYADIYKNLKAHILELYPDIREYVRIHRKSRKVFL